MICPHSTPLHRPELTDRASKPKSVTMDGKMCHYKTIHNIKLSLALPQCTRFTGKNRKTNDKIAEYHTLDSTLALQRANWTYRGFSPDGRTLGWWTSSPGCRSRCWATSCDWEGGRGWGRARSSPCPRGSCAEPGRG